MIAHIDIHSNPISQVGVWLQVINKLLKIRDRDFVQIEELAVSINVSLTNLEDTLDGIGLPDEVL